MIPNDLAKTSTPAVKRVLPYSIVLKEDSCLPNSSTEAISITQAGTQTRKVIAINGNDFPKFQVLIFGEEISNTRSLSLLHGL